MLLQYAFDFREISELRLLVFPATPATGAILHVNAKATAGGDGSKAKPFHTLEAAVIAATAPGPKTILLAGGKYHTVGVTLTTAHSDLTIQNENGAEAIISGSVPVLNTLSKVTIPLLFLPP